MDPRAELAHAMAAAIPRIDLSAWDAALAEARQQLAEAWAADKPRRNPRRLLALHRAAFVWDGATAGCAPPPHLPQRRTHRNRPTARQNGRTIGHST